tara:strand:- start:308 stop:997 length:690 start_codon:yes stop_codon:yes gene_type:complete
MEKYIKIRSDDGFHFGCYAARPDGSCKGALIVIQEIFGVNSHIRDVVDGYARNGYFTIAPQIFDRIEPDIQLNYDEADMNRGIELAFQKLEMRNTLSDLQATITYASKYGKVGVVGYCFGGLLSWLSACQLEGVDAAIAYYGGGLISEKDLKPQCPVLMHFGNRDAHIPLSDVDIIKEAQPESDIHIYEADHGFNCSQRDSYEEKSANLALERSLELLAKHLTGITYDV